MTREEVFAELKEVIKVVRPTLDVESVSFDTRLVEDLALDSLSMMFTAMAVENRLDIRFDTSHPFHTVADVCDAAIEQLKSK